MSVCFLLVLFKVLFCVMFYCDERLSYMHQMILTLTMFFIQALVSQLIKMDPYFIVKEAHRLTKGNFVK